MKNLKIEIKWAIIFAIVGLLWMLGEKLAGLHGEHIDRQATYSFLFSIPAIAVYVFALLDKRRNFYHGSMTYKQGFVTGLIISVFVAILSPLTQYITSTVITPEYFPNAIDYAVREGQMTQEAAENFFNMQSYIVQGLIWSLGMGLVTSAIVALFVRKE